MGGGGEFNRNKLLSLIDLEKKIEILLEMKLWRETEMAQYASETSLDSLQSLCHKRQEGIGFNARSCVCA